MSIARPTLPPTLENYFNLNIGHEYDWVPCPSAPGEENPASSMLEITLWKNPHLGSLITSYIPVESLNFNPTIQSGFFNNIDVMVVVLSSLDLKNVINCSTVCKSFYTALKSDSIWRVQLCQFLPNVTVIAPNLCIFNPQQQFSIIFKRIENECKPYIAKFNRNQELSIVLLNELKTLELQYQEAGGETAACRYDRRIANVYTQFMNNPQNNPADLHAQIMAYHQNSSDYSAHMLSFRIKTLKHRLQRLLGANYDGTTKSIDPNSIQGQIMNAIKMLVPNAFDNQEKFEDVIRMAETAKNNSSSNSDGPIIEDVTGVSEPKDQL
jgi:hypothetical protein